MERFSYKCRGSETADEAMCDWIRAKNYVLSLCSANHSVSIGSGEVRVSAHLASTAAASLIHCQLFTDHICLQRVSFIFVAYDAGLSLLCVYTLRPYFLGLITNFGYSIKYV